MQMNEVKIPKKQACQKGELIIHILASLPEEYEVTVSFLEDHLMDSLSKMPFGIEFICEEEILCHDRVKQHGKDE